MERWSWRLVAWLQVATVVAFGVAPVGGQDLPHGMDPAAAVNMLTDASAEEQGPAPPFMGLATRIEVDRLFGTATSTIPIEVPPGRKGMTPDLTIRYSSNAGSGPFGVGWDLPLGCIKRNTAHGVPWDYTAATYSDATGFVLMFRGGTILLDTCVDSSSPCTSWKASSEETWLSAQLNRTTKTWTVTDKNGLMYTYGDALARTGVDTNSVAKTFGWYLTQIKDPNGNTIRVQYKVNSNAADQRKHAYPERIDYGNNTGAGFTDIFHVKLEYESRPDVVTSYRGGFEDRLDLRATDIKVWVDGLSGETTPTRQYQFAYGQDPDTGLSLLTSVSETVATTVPPTTAPPATTFTYSNSARALAAPAPLSFDGGTPCSGGRVEVTYVGGVVTGFLDVDADGLPDYLDAYDDQCVIDAVWGGGGLSVGGGLRLYRNRGDGTFKKDIENNGLWTTWTGDFFTHLPRISSVPVSLLDINGDALPDVVQARGGSATCPQSSSTCSWDVRTTTGGSRSPGDIQHGTPGLWPGVPPDLQMKLPAPLPPSTAAQLIDLTGDGLPDILDCAGSAPSANAYACRPYVNTGDSFARLPDSSVPVLATLGATSASALAAEVVTSPPSRTQLKRLVDLNGDGLPDLVNSRSLSGLGHWDVALGTGKGFAEVRDWPAPPYDIQYEGYAADNDYGLLRGLQDMNGDGLLDYVDATTVPRWTVYFNSGASFRAGVEWAGTEGLLFVSRGFGSGTTEDSEVLDLNGDGIGDVVELAPSGGLQARYGSGTRGNLLIHQENGLGGSCQASYVASTDRTSAGSGCVEGTNAGAPCLTSSECPGGSCAAACPDCSQLPFPAWVVDRLAMRSGFADPTDGYVTEFTFTGGSFDPVGHQFRGFRQSLEHRLGDPLHDPLHDPQHERNIRRQFAAPPFATSTNPAWPSPVPSRPFKLVDEQVRDVNTGKTLSRTLIDWDAQPLDPQRWKVHPIQRRDITYSTATGQTATLTRTQAFNQYDDFNNVTIETVTGDGVPAPIVTTTTYAASAPCHGQPTKVVVTDGLLALSERDFTYDSRCNLFTVSARLAASGQPATGGRLVTTTLDYDQSSQNADAAAAKAGQPTKITDSRGNATRLLYSTSSPNCNTFGLYPCRTALPTTTLYMRIDKTYDLRWGKPLSITDATDPNNANNVKTTFTYDGLGRLTEVTRPLDLYNGSGSSYAWRAFAYSFGAAATATAPARTTRIDTKIREPNDTLGHRIVSSFFDGLGRPLESKQQQYVDAMAYTVVHDAVSFDAVGRVAARYAPFVAATNDLTTYDTPATGTAHTSLSYDVADRVISTTNPDGTTRTVDYGVAGQVTTRDENYTSGGYPGAQTVESHDALGRVIRQERYTKAPAGNDVLITTSDTAYDGLGRVTMSQTTDPATTKVATTRFDYDSLGRRTTMTDPDSGTWAYDYDDAGNLVYQDDPRTNQHFEFCYDAVNRATRKLYVPSNSRAAAADYTNWCNPSIYPEQSSSSNPNPLAAYVLYTYDGGVNGAGRLTTVSTREVDGSAVTTNYYYDARGRVTMEDLFRSVVIAGQSRSLGTAFTYVYDTADRLATVTYPDTTCTPEQLCNTGSESFSYTYNDLGQLNGAYTAGQTYALSMRYDLLGRLTQWTLGSGLVERASYDTTGGDRFRLQQLRTAPDATSNDSLQRFDYANRYDRAGISCSSPTVRATRRG